MREPRLSFASVPEILGGRDHNVSYHLGGGIPLAWIKEYVGRSFAEINWVISCSRALGGAVSDRKNRRHRIDHAFVRPMAVPECSQMLIIFVFARSSEGLRQPHRALVGRRPIILATRLNIRPERRVERQKCSCEDAVHMELAGREKGGIKGGPDSCMLTHGAPYVQEVSTRSYPANAARPFHARPRRSSKTLTVKIAVHIHRHPVEGGAPRGTT